MVLDAVYVVLSIFMLIGVGMLITKLGWVDDKGAKLLSGLVVKVGLSGLIVHKLFTSYTRESLIANANGMIAPYVSMLLGLALGYAIAHLRKIPKGRRGVFTCMFAFSNSVFIGVPVALALFGDEVMPYSLLYYIANTTLFWSIGYLLMSRDGGAGGKIDLRKLVPVPLIAFVISVCGVLLGVKLPQFLLSTANYLGGLVTPLSLIYTGWVIMSMLQTGNVRWEKGYGFILIGRFIAAPLLLLLTSGFVPMPALMRNALLIQASMPVMAQTPIVAAACGADAEYAAGGIAISTACSLAAIPAYMALIRSFL